jgi:Protein of unknown function with HXXEE motif
MGQRRGIGEQDVGPTITWGLLAAWTVHDLEEVLAFGPWQRSGGLGRMCVRLPFVPGAAFDAAERITPRRYALAVGLVGGVMAAASARGAATGGRSPLFQGLLTGFGMHAFTHAGWSLAAGGYTPGVATTPTIVVPFSCLAIRRLRRAGLATPVSPTEAVAGLVGAVLLVQTSHVVAAVLDRFVLAPILDEQR